MIVNPSREREMLATYAGTRILKNDFGLTGRYVCDPRNASRRWRIEMLYAPLTRAALISTTGIRARFTDHKGFITFAMQMDLEVLLGMYKPGQTCPWSGRSYDDPTDHDFNGLQADTEDLQDDLYGRELVLRGMYLQELHGGLPPKANITRRIHLYGDRDFEETHVLVRDFDPVSGQEPDYQLSNVTSRWACAERVPVAWESVL